MTTQKEFLKLLDELVERTGGQKPYIMMRDQETAQWWRETYGDGSAEYPFKYADGGPRNVTPEDSEKAVEASGDSEQVDRIAQAARDAGSTAAALVMLRQYIEGKDSK